MELSPGFGLVAVALLVLANGFFVATEFAIVAVRRSRLDQLAAEGSATAAAARQLVSHLDTFIAACQLGITMASLALGWIGEPAFAHLEAWRCRNPRARRSSSRARCWCSTPSSGCRYCC